jgi:hypothetical protein
VVTYIASLEVFIRVGLAAQWLCEIVVEDAQMMGDLCAAVLGHNFSGTRHQFFTQAWRVDANKSRWTASCNLLRENVLHRLQALQVFVEYINVFFAEVFQRRHESSNVYSSQI